MRTTVTLDPDVALLVKEAMRQGGLPFKTVLNDALRRALAPSEAPAPFVQRTFAMGRPRLDLTKALALAGELEDQHVLAHYRP